MKIIGIIFLMIFPLYLFSQERDTIVCNCKLLSIDSFVVNNSLILKFKKGRVRYNVLSKLNKYEHIPSGMKELQIKGRYTFKIYEVGYWIQTDPIGDSIVGVAISNRGNAFWVDDKRILRAGESFYVSNDIKGMYVRERK